MSAIEHLGNLIQETENKLDNISYMTGLQVEDGKYVPVNFAEPTEPPYWRKRNMLNLLAGNNVNVQTTIPFTDEDMRVIEKKNQMPKIRNLMDAAFKFFRPENGPANREYMNKIMPELLEIQKDTIEKYHDTVKQIEMIKIAGPKNMDDIILMVACGIDGLYANPGTKDDPYLMLRNQELMNYIKKENMPTVSAIPNPSVFKTQQQKNFEKGLFHTARRERFANSLLYGNGAAMASMGAGDANWGSKGIRGDANYIYNTAPTAPLSAAQYLFPK